MRGRITANITFFIAVMSLLGCNPPASQTGPPSTTAVNEQSYEEMMVVRDRINILADPDMEGKFQKDDIEFLKNTAVEGELVNSSMSFTLLRIAMKDKAVEKDDVVACYIQRLKKVSGMKAVIAMRNLENLIAQRLAANIEKRDDLIALVQANDETPSYTKQEKHFAADLLKSGTDKDLILLLELITTKSDPSSTQWRLDQIAKAKTLSNNAQVNQLIDIVEQVFDR